MTSLNRWARPLLHRVVGPAETTCTMFDGQRLTVVLPEIVGTALYRYGYIEAPLTQVLLERLRPGMVFFDVGAQYGYFSLVAHRLVGPTGTVVAFEPARDTLRLLRRNVAGLDGVVVEACAVDARSGTVRLTDFGRRHSALNTLLGGARVPAPERRRLRAGAYEVGAVSLDDYVAARAVCPDVVKIDAEGAETAILAGMTKVLRQASPLVALETGDYDGMASPSTSASIDALEALGYRPFEYASTGLRGPNAWNRVRGPNARNGLRPHRRRPTYGYGNLFFLKDRSA